MRFSQAKAPVLANEQRPRWDLDNEKNTEEEQGLGDQQQDGGVTGSGVAVQGDYDQQGGSNQGGDDLYAALDAALTELEGEHRAFAREVATPTKDALQTNGQGPEAYQADAMDSIATDRITSAPAEQKTPGRNIIGKNASMQSLLSRNLLSAQMGHERRRSMSARV